MDQDRHKMAEQILDLTLEIIYLLTGEDHTALKTPGGCADPHPRVWRESQSPITVPSPQSLIHPGDNEQKILELTNKIIHLLTGEVPIRCQDVTVYLTMEEWEYLEEHKAQYRELMMEDPRPLTSQGGSRTRNTVERGPSPQDGSSGNRNVPHHEVNDLIIVKVEENEGEEGSNADDPPSREEETPSNMSPGDYSSGGSEGHLLPCSHCDGEPTTIRQDPYGDPFTTPISPSAHPSGGPPSDPTEPSSEPPQAPQRFPWSEYREYCRRKRNALAQKSADKDDRQFSCPECEKCFSYKSNLSDHVKVHTGEKPHLCADCGKCFTRKSDLVRHRRTHSGERPYSCALCGKNFAMKSILVGHEKTHTGEKPFPCVECGKSFNRKFSLAVHQRIHTGERPFSCPQCEKSYTNKKQLLLHQRAHAEGHKIP